MPYTSLTSPTQVGELKVAASTTKDFPGLKNTTSGTVRVRLTAKGQWCLLNVPTKDPELAIFNSQTDWKGLQSVPNYTKFKWKAPELQAGSLIAEIKDPRSTSLFMISAPMYVELAPGCTADFFMNDDPRWVGDNSGEITLSYNCTPAASIPAPMVKTFEGNSPEYVGIEVNSNRVALKKMISYAGVDFYPYYGRQTMLLLNGLKQGRLTKNFNLISHKCQEITDVVSEPETQMVKLTTSKTGASPRIPWCYMADTIATNNTDWPGIVGISADGQYSWAITGGHVNW